MVRPGTCRFPVISWGERIGEKWQDYALLAFLALIVYGRILGHEFLYNWDDHDYVVNNTAIRGFSLDHLRTVFTNTGLRRLNLAFAGFDQPLYFVHGLARDDDARHPRGPLGQRQFDLRQPILVRGARATTLQAQLPSELYRFQRRSSFRVRTLERHSPSAALRHPAIADMRLTLRVLDVSIGGCALFLPDDVPPFDAGVRLDGVRIELDAETRFIASLVMHHVTSIAPSSRGVRLGCEWVSLDGNAERALQRYIDQTQKRRRLMSLD